MKSLFLLPFLLLGLLLFKGAAIFEAANSNLAGIETVRDWSSNPKTLSQIICQENVQKGAAGSNAGQAAVVNAARRAYFAGDCESALAYWDLARGIDPQNETAALMEFLSAGLEAGYFPLDASPEDMSGFLYGLGLQAEQNQEEKQAYYWFAKSFEQHPSRLAADRLISSQTNPEKQVHIWLSLADTLPDDDPNYWWALGQYLTLEEDWEGALQAYTAGALIAPKPYEFLMEQGKVLSHMQAWDKAVSIYQSASDQRPTDVNPYLEIGHIYRQQGELNKAKASYEKALAISSQHFTAVFFLGFVHYQLEDDLQAEYHLQRALDLKPAHAPSAYYLAQTLHRSGNSQAALEYLEKAVSLAEEKPWRWLIQLGDWRYAAGNVQGALEVYKEALDLQPGNPELRKKVDEIQNMP